MTCFNDRETPYPCLEIMDDKQNSCSKALILRVHPPVIGVFPLARKLLEAPIHLTEWSTIETKDVVYNFSGKVMNEKVLLLKSSTHQNVVDVSPPRRDENLSSWRAPPSGFGEVRYSSGYWEWVEDVLARNKETLDRNKTYDAIFASLFTYDHNENVLQAFCENWRPSTNTVSTFIGELSLSLWDLRTIGGLPVHGTFYDEVIPSAKELTHVDDQGKPFLPRSCSYLFSAFYRLTKGVINEVTFHDWIKFWFRGAKKYAEPSQKSSKSRTKPRMNHDPSGNIDMTFLPRTEEENAPFIELGVEESLRDETYLAAFLACWLCKFVLPNKKFDCVRASVFEVASLMAHGEKFSLAVPVLASIYHGLREISTSPNLGSCKALLPIHYVYGWIGEYFDTYYHVNRPQRGVQIWQISGEKMAKYFDLVDARKLFQQVNIHNLHHLALLQKKELHLDDKGKLSNSWSDFFISLRSSFITLRHDDDLIVKAYSPHRFSQQFGFCQDVPGVLIEHHYDSSLQALVQLWDSCVQLGSLSKFIIPMRPSDKGPLMTREYSDWWPAHRESVLRRSTYIILKGLRKDDASLSTKGDQLQPDRKGKQSKSSESKVTPSTSSQSVQVISKPNNSKVKDTHVTKEVKSPPLTLKAAELANFKEIDTTHKRKKPSNPSNKIVEKPPSVVPFCNNASKPPALLHGTGLNTSAASSSNESNVSQETHWKRLKKKSKDLNNQHNEFADLDSISIDTTIFEDGVADSIMPLAELALQLGLGDISSDLDVFEDCITSPNPSNVAKSAHLSLAEVKSQATNENSLTKLTMPPLEKVEHSLHVSTINKKVEANQVECSNVSKDFVEPLQRIVPNFEPQETISAFKLSYVSGMWRTLCECITQFSAESSENLKELETGVSLILKGLREANIINLSPLEVLLEIFFKKHRDYDVARSSTSQKITTDSHQELLSAAQQCLHTANEEKIKVDKRLRELQKVLERAEKELGAWTSKKKKTISLIEEHQKILSENQERITNSEDTIHALEKISSLVKNRNKRAS